MIQEEYNYLKIMEAHHNRNINADSLKPFLKNRTLIYGCTSEGLIFHVYLKKMQIHSVTYKMDYSTKKPRPINMKEIKITSNADYIPDKKIYPEKCDFIFCKVLLDHDVDLPLAPFCVNNSPKEFYGFTLEDANNRE